MPSSDRPRARSSTAPESADLTRPARIVIADDDRLARELLAGILRNAGHTVDACEDGQEAVDRVAQGGVDLVLLDVVMPRLSGLEACRLLKGMLVDSFLPVVLVTVKTDTQSRVEGLRIGADDYVCKPFEEAELVARVGSMLRIKRLHDVVTVQKARFERLSVHDEMTGLYNYRYLHTRLNEEFKRAERYHEPFACVLVDIDQLRAINDLGGRVAGDDAIRKVAEGIKRCVREVDVVARYGGEEFLIVLPSTHFAGSVVVAERIWREVSGRPIDVEPRDARRISQPPPARKPWDEPEPRPAIDPRWADGPRELTVSIGVALYPSRDVRTKDALIRASESALSQAKREGGNRICVYQQQGYIYTPSIAGSQPSGSSRPLDPSRSNQEPPPSTRSPSSSRISSLPFNPPAPPGALDRASRALDPGAADRAAVSMGPQAAPYPGPAERAPASTRTPGGSSASGPASSRAPTSVRGDALRARPRRSSDSMPPGPSYDASVGNPRSRTGEAPDSQEPGRKSS